MRGTSKILKDALKDKRVAMAIIGQSTTDEGSIGTDGSIEVSYTSYGPSHPQH